MNSIVVGAQIGVSFLTGISVIVTAVFASRGLNTWRKKLLAEHGFKLAKEINHATIVLRNAVVKARDPHITLFDYPDHRMPQNDWPNAEYVLAVNPMWDTRLELIREPLEKFQVIAIEAEAVWGADIKVKLDEFEQSVSNFKIATFHLCVPPAVDAERPAHIARWLPVATGATNDEANEMSQRLKISVEGIFDYTRNYLIG
jgi:hypothetical protein